MVLEIKGIICKERIDGDGNRGDRQKREKRR